MGLEGKVAVVTGAGQGIGRAIALRLARDGADIVVADLNSQTAEAVAGEVQALGRRGLAVAVDMLQPEDRAHMVAATLAEFGRIDLLVNNAGINRVVPWDAVTERDWDLHMDLNAKALFFCCQAVLAEMRKQKSGKIINIASQAGKLANPLMVPYCASKAAAISITRCLAIAVAAEGINVNCVCPGFIDTPMWDYMDSIIAPMEGLPRGGAKEKRAQAIPMKRFGTADEIANVVAFLASSDADYMTGQAINVTGGFMLH